MDIIESKTIKGLYSLKDKVFADDRGSYRQFFDLGDWVKGFNGDALFTFNPHQTSASVSRKGVMRGFHGDYCTKKLVSCPFGKLQLILIDVSRNSDTYGHTETYILSEDENLSVLVPATCGVGHLILSNKAMFHYLQSTSYGHYDQYTLSYEDPAVRDLWQEKPSIISDRDKKGLFLDKLN
tara:strand:- start:1535 stop:2077 length:543 start_codon:yes stop_codon:yes gene_type:complete